MHFFRWLFFIVPSCLATTVDAHAQVNVKDSQVVLEVEQEAIESAKSETGLKMTASVPARPVAGSPIPISIVLRNEATSNVSAWLPRLEGFTVKAKNGEISPLTRFGADHLRPDLSVFLRALSAHINELSPGEKCTITIPNVALYYDLTVAGEYWVSVRVRLKKDGSDAVEDLSVAPLRVVVRNPVLLETTRK